MKRYFVCCEPWRYGSPWIVRLQTYALPDTRRGKGFRKYTEAHKRVDRLRRWAQKNIMPMGKSNEATERS